MRTQGRASHDPSRRGGAAVALGLVLTLGCLLGAKNGAPPDLAPEASEPPAAGRFLVATENIRGSIFQESVVYLVNYARTGAIGLIVNRPSDVELHEVVQGAVDGSGTLYVGGPVEHRSVMMLLRADSPPERATHVSEDVFVSVDPGMLLAYTAEHDAGRLRVYAGYAGWGRGQLDREIARGDWMVVRSPPSAIFEEKPEELWKKLFRRHHRLLTTAPSVRAFRS